MSNEAHELLSFIQDEYDNRLKSGIPDNQAIVFEKSSIPTKFDNISDLLEELSDYGYIQKWITGDFIFKVE